MKPDLKLRPRYCTTSLSQFLRDHFDSLFPQEVCGLICESAEGHISFIPLNNTSTTDRCCSFQVSGSDVLDWCLKSRHQNLKMLAWVHSHPQGKSDASAEDRAFWWGGDDWLWPGMDQLILWPHRSQGLQMSIYGPQTHRCRPLPYWQGPLKQLERRITVDRCSMIEHNIR